MGFALIYSNLLFVARSFGFTKRNQKVYSFANGLILFLKRDLHASKVSDGSNVTKGGEMADDYREDNSGIH